MTRFATVFALLMTAGACTTLDHQIEGIEIQPQSAATPGDGNGYLLVNLLRCPTVMAGICPAVTPHLRVRINGRQLVAEGPDGTLTDDVVRTGVMFSQVDTLLPSGDYLLEFVTDDDDVWSTASFHLPANVDYSSQLFVSGTGSHSWFVPAELNDDVFNWHSTIINVTDTPLELRRCETADQTTTCTVLGTAPSLGAWTGNIATRATATSPTVTLHVLANGTEIGVPMELALPAGDAAYPWVDAYVKEPNGTIRTWFGSNWDF